MRKIGSVLCILGLVAGAGLVALLMFYPPADPNRLARAARPGASATSPATPLDPKSVHVLVANIRLPKPEDVGNMWSDRRELVAGTVLAQNPDIVGFQEVSPIQASYLLGHLPGLTLVPHTQGSGAVGALAAFADIVGSMNELYFRSDRFNLLVNESGPLRPDAPQDDPTDNAYFTLAVLEDKNNVLPPLIVLDTHLRHTVPNATESAERIHTLLGVQLAAYPNAQCIIMGDMNHDRTTPVYTALRGAATTTELFDSFDYAHRAINNGRLGTYHAFTGISRDPWPSDLIFATRGLTADPAKIITDKDEKTGKFPSDHFFVSTTYHIPPLPPSPTPSIPTK